jgi:hypothetical protein
MIRYYRCKSSDFVGMVCIKSCLSSVVCGCRVMCVRFKVACNVYGGDLSKHRGIHRSVVLIERYIGP